MSWVLRSRMTPTLYYSGQPGSRRWSYERHEARVYKTEGQARRQANVLYAHATPADVFTMEEAMASRCRGVTTHGSRCRRTTVHEKQVCHDHRDFGSWRGIAHVVDTCDYCRTLYEAD